MLHVLLPTLPRCGDDPRLRTWLVRGDRLQDAERGYLAALGGHFRLPTPVLPVGALTRDQAVDDAEGATWLCADPCFVQAEMTGARMLACGTLDLDADEAEQLARALRPLFGDRGCLLETTEPARWHVMLPRSAHPPAFATPDQVLGADLLAHLPQGADGKRWRALFNEAQVILHQHPVNAARRARGQAPANSLWLWGGGALPAWVKTPLVRMASDAPLAQALGARARIPVQAVAEFDADAAVRDPELLDLETVADLQPWWPSLQQALQRRGGLQLEFAGGERVRVLSRHRFRLWRRVA